MNRAYYAFTALAMGLVLVGAGCVPNTINTPPVEQPPANNDDNSAYAGWLTYTNNNEGYSIKYPADFTVKADSTISPVFGSFPAVKFVIPDRYFTGTNLSQDSGIFMYKSCLLEGIENATAVMTTAGKNKFKEYKISDAGAGNFYESDILSVQSGTYCYNLMSFLHDLNVDNFAPGQTVTQYDRKGLTDILYKMAGSLEMVR